MKEWLEKQVIHGIGRGYKVKMERLTKQKKAILEAMQSACRPLMPQEILLIAQEAVPALGIATVYRNLKLLLEDGRIRTVELPAEATRYEMAPECHDDHHHHFLCTQCTRAFDVHGCAHDFANMVPPGFVVNAHEITLYGLCEDCVKPRSGIKAKAANKVKVKAHAGA